jgi:hypothetical protein
MEGWIKLYRKFCEWEWYNISEMVHLFIHLLLNANQKDGEWRGILIKRGQILTGLNSLNEKTGISVQTLRTCLLRLESTNEITSKVTNKYRIITILKYDDYQSINGTINNQINKQLTINQQSTNNKQEEEEYKEKNNTNWRSDFSIYLSECKLAYKSFMEDVELLKTQQRLNPRINIKLSIEKGYVNFWGTEGGWKFKKGKRSKEINWKSTIINSIGMNKVYYTKEELSKL